MDYSLKEVVIEQFFEKVKDSILPSESNNYKSKFLQSNFLLYCVVLLLVIRIGTTLFSINIPQNIFFADITKSSLENFVNQTRQSSGLQPLTENSQLDQAAQLKAQNMVQNNYFNHISPTGVSPWFWFLQAGYKYKYAGENLAIGFFDSEEVYNAWLNSPEHKANIVNPNYTNVGTAVVSGFGPNNSIVVVQEFGSQLPPKQTVAKNSATKPAVTQTNTQTTNTKTTNTQITNTTNNTQTTNTNTTNTQTSTTNEKVLGQETESHNIIKPATGVSSNNLPAKVTNSVLYNYDAWLQDIIFGMSMIVIGIFLTLIFFNFKISFKRHLVFRAALLLILLSVATLASKETIISLIPHQMSI